MIANAPPPGVDEAAAHRLSEEQTVPKFGVDVELERKRKRKRKGAPLRGQAGTKAPRPTFASVCREKLLSFS